MKIFGFIISLLLPICAFAQQNTEDPEKEFREAIDVQVEEYAKLFNLEDWQVFYVDSIFTHDYAALKDELQELNASKVSNSDVYVKVQDKWSEQIYQSLQKVFDENQWKKYLKTGAQREKNSRDKRAKKK